MMLYRFYDYIVWDRYEKERQEKMGLDSQVHKQNREGQKKRGK